MAKPESGRVMELELPHRFRMIAQRAIIYYDSGEPRVLVRIRSSFEATAEELRFQDKACHA